MTITKYTLAILDLLQRAGNQVQGQRKEIRSATSIFSAPDDKALRQNFYPLNLGLATAQLSAGQQSQTRPFLRRPRGGPKGAILFDFHDFCRRLQGVPRELLESGHPPCPCPPATDPTRQPTAAVWKAGGTSSRKLILRKPLPWRKADRDGSERARSSWH